MMDVVSQKRTAARLRIENREKDIAAKFAKLEQWKKDLNDKINKKTAEAEAAKVNTFYNMKAYQKLIFRVVLCSYATKAI